MEQPTKTLLDTKAQEAIVRGVRAIYEPVRRTLGPSGSNALLYRTYNRGSRITNDGITIAGVIEPKNEFDQLVSSTFREAAKKTNEKAGDGTTSTVVIGGKLILGMFDTLSESSSIIQTNSSKKSVIALKNELIEAKDKVIEKIKERAKEIKTIEELEEIACVSVEDQELGKVISKMVWEVGVDGFVDTVEGYKGEIETEIIKGMRFPAKVAAKAFVTNPARFEMIAQEVPTVVTNFAFDNPVQLRFCNANVLETSKLVIFAPSFSEPVLVELVKAWKNNFQIYPVLTPSLRTDQYEDLATYTASTFINKDKGMKLDRITKADLGYAEKIVVKDTDAREDAAVIGGGGTKDREVKVNNMEMSAKSAVAERIETLQKQVDETKDDIRKKMLQRRIASMSSAIGIIRVGASTQAESLYKKLKIEDAVYASKAALQEGYVKGGGLCLKEIAEELPESLLTEALKAPYEQIQENAGGIEIGESIIDPAKVVRLSVEHAVSVASNLITVRVIIPESREKNPAEGYEAIADAIMTYTKFWARYQGLLKENELEIEKDNMRHWEEKIENDTG